MKMLPLALIAIATLTSSAALAGPLTGSVAGVVSIGGQTRSVIVGPGNISSGAGGKPGEAQSNGSVLETLLSLILSEKAGINIQENAASSKPLEEFIRQFTPSGSTGNGESSKRVTSAEKAAASG